MRIFLACGNLSRYGIALAVKVRGGNSHVVESQPLDIFSSVDEQLTPRAGYLVFLVGLPGIRVVLTS